MTLVLSASDIAYFSVGLFLDNVCVRKKRFALPPEQWAAAMYDWIGTTDLVQIKSIVAVVGPGSPTALRASLSFANTLAFVYELPLFPVETDASTPLESVRALADFTFSKKQLVPVYLREANVTKPKTK